MNSKRDGPVLQAHFPACEPLTMGVVSVKLGTQYGTKLQTELPSTRPLGRRSHNRSLHDWPRNAVQAKTGHSYGLSNLFVIMNKTAHHHYPLPSTLVVLLLMDSAT